MSNLRLIVRCQLDVLGGAYSFIWPCPLSAVPLGMPLRDAFKGPGPSRGREALRVLSLHLIIGHSSAQMSLIESAMRCTYF